MVKALDLLCTCLAETSSLGKLPSIKYDIIDCARAGTGRTSKTGSSISIGSTAYPWCGIWLTASALALKVAVHKEPPDRPVDVEVDHEQFHDLGIGEGMRLRLLRDEHVSQDEAGVSMISPSSTFPRSA